MVNIAAPDPKDRQCDQYIGRGSYWGNPYIIGEHGDRATVIRRFEAYLRSNPDMLAKVGLLKGKRLGCYCAPKACHGDLLAKLADAI